MFGSKSRSNLTVVLYQREIFLNPFQSHSHSHPSSTQTRPTPRSSINTDETEGNDLNGQNIELGSEGDSLEDVASGTVGNTDRLLPTDDPILYGTVLVDLSSSKQVQSLTVFLEGVTCTYICNSSGALCQTSKTFSKSLSIDLGGQILPQGTTSFEFSFIIPSSTAVTLSCSYGTTDFYVKAYLLTPFKSITSPPAPLILSPSPTPFDSTPYPLELQIEHLSSDLGPVLLTLSSPNLTPGSLLAVNIHLVSSFEDLEMLSVKIFLGQRFEIKYSYGEEDFVTKPIRKRVELGAVDPDTQSLDFSSLRQSVKQGSEWAFGRLMRVPEDWFIKPTTLKGSRTRIRVDSSLIVEARYIPKGGKEKIFSAKKEVFVGTCRGMTDEYLLPRYSTRAEYQPHPTRTTSLPKSLTLSSLSSLSSSPQPQPQPQSRPRSFSLTSIKKFSKTPSKPKLPPSCTCDLSLPELLATDQALELIDHARRVELGRGWDDAVRASRFVRIRQGDGGALDGMGGLGMDVNIDYEEAREGRDSFELNSSRASVDGSNTSHWAHSSSSSSSSPTSLTPAPMETRRRSSSFKARIRRFSILGSPPPPSLEDSSPSPPARLSSISPSTPRPLSTNMSTMFSRSGRGRPRGLSLRELKMMNEYETVVYEEQVDSQNNEQTSTPSSPTTPTIGGLSGEDIVRVKHARVRGSMGRTSVGLETGAILG